jgi:WD40 repeat protein
MAITALYGRFMSIVNTPPQALINPTFEVGVSPWTWTECLATSTLLATGSADNTVRLWNVQDGTCLHTWEFPTAVKRVEFSEDGSMLLAVTEQRMGHVGTVVVFPINEDGPRISTPSPPFSFVGQS